MGQRVFLPDVDSDTESRPLLQGLKAESHCHIMCTSMKQFSGAWGHGSYVTAMKLTQGTFELDVR